MSVPISTAFYERNELVTTESTARRSDAERNVERIVDAAIACLSEQNDAAMGEIAARAGVGRATLYRHFPNRVTLLEAIHDRAVSEAEDAVLASRPEEGPAAEAMSRLVESLAGVIERYRVLSTHKHELSDERESDVIRSYVVGVIERGQASGEFTQDVPSGVLADMLKGMMMAACTEGDAVPAGRLVARVLVHGLDPDPST